MAEILKSLNAFNAKRLFGITTLDVIRSSTFIAQLVSRGPSPEFIVPVIGGHSTNTIVPLFSQTKPSVNLNEDQTVSLTHRIQLAGDEVLKAKAGSGSATLSMAYAANRSFPLLFLLVNSRFLNSLLQGMRGARGIIEPAFVYLPGIPGGDCLRQFVNGLEYFSINVELGVNASIFYVAEDRWTAQPGHTLWESSAPQKKPFSRYLSMN